MDIPNGLTVQQMRKAIVDMTQRMFVESPKPSLVKRARLGGAKRSFEESLSAAPRADFAQFLDLADLFRDVCGAAAGHVESTLTQAIIASRPDLFADGNYHPEVLMKSERETPLDVKIRHINNPQTVVAMREIAYKWQTGLVSIRENADDAYGVPYQPTNTDKLLNFLLSFATLPDGSCEYDPYISTETPAQAEFIRGKLLTGTVCPEVRLAILLTVFDNELNADSKPDKYFADVHPWTKELAPVSRGVSLNIDSAAEWSALTTYVQSGILNIGGSAPPVMNASVGGNRTTYRRRTNTRRTIRN